MTYKELGIENDKPGWGSKNAPLWHFKVKNMWYKMWDRCNNPNRRDYKYYCESIIYEDFRYLSKYIEWIESQPRFKEFCSTCHEITWTIDKDMKCIGNKNYFPEYMTLCPLKENLKDRFDRCGYPTERKAIKGTSLIDGSVLIFDYINEALDKGFNPSAISKCCRGVQVYHIDNTWE